MASPLLEAGAIDGARGILINITGSNSLKLSEVNEASTIIQNAAHEDANIIFGAVQDENMGDEVKITVIATGFREEMPQRRERMLSAAAFPASVEPVAPRIAPRAPSAPRFASEEVPVPVTGRAAGQARTGTPGSPGNDDVGASRQAALREPMPRQPQAPVPLAEAGREPGDDRAQTEETRRPVNSVSTAPAETRPAASAGGAETVSERPGSYVPGRIAEHHTELVPVPASVFDDEFFQKPNEELRASQRSAWGGDRSGDVRNSGDVQEAAAEDSGHDSAETHWPEARIPSFAGYAGDAAPQSDELDIPAFLRRTH
jgi:cell division protein FtsZ